MKEGVGSKMRQKLFHWLVAVWFLFSVSAHLLYVKRTKSEKKWYKVGGDTEKSVPVQIECAFFSRSYTHKRHNTWYFALHVTKISIHRTHVENFHLNFAIAEKRESIYKWKFIPAANRRWRTDQKHSCYQVETGDKRRICVVLALLQFSSIQYKLTWIHSEKWGKFNNGK